MAASFTACLCLSLITSGSLQPDTPPNRFNDASLTHTLPQTTNTCHTLGLGSVTRWGLGRPYPREGKRTQLPPLLSARQPDPHSTLQVPSPYVSPPDSPSLTPRRADWSSSLENPPIVYRADCTASEIDEDPAPSRTSTPNGFDTSRSVKPADPGPKQEPKASLRPKPSSSHSIVAESLRQAPRPPPPLTRPTNPGAYSNTPRQAARTGNVRTASAYSPSSGSSAYSPSSGSSPATSRSPASQGQALRPAPKYSHSRSPHSPHLAVFWSGGCYRVECGFVEIVEVAGQQGWAGGRGAVGVHNQTMQRLPTTSFEETAAPLSGRPISRC